MIPQSQAHFDPDWIGGDGLYVSAVCAGVKPNRELETLFFGSFSRRKSWFQRARQIDSTFR